MFGVTDGGIKSGEYLELSRRMEKMGGNAIQLVIGHNAYSSNSSYYPSKEDIECRRDKIDMYLVAHGIYTINLCNLGYQFTHNKAELIREMKVCEMMNCDLIIHQGKNTTKGQTEQHAIDIYVKAVSEIIRDSETKTVKILLENSSHTKSDMGYSIDGLAEIYSRFDDEIKSRIGFCLDTCHAFVAGQLDMRKKESVEKFLNEFDGKIGLENLIVVHMNDSKVPYGSCIDRHEDWGYGYITNLKLEGSFNGVAYFIKEMVKRNIPMILETNGEKYEMNIKMLKCLANMGDIENKKEFSRIYKKHKLAIERYSEQIKNQSKKKKK
jgi:apurinic endonuclease APN1